MSPHSAKPVIRDVARVAGVSVPTVSRVLTGSARVSDEKRERVLEAIAELGFRPSAEARALVARQPTLIAVVAGNTSRYGYAETIRGVEEAARGNGYSVAITVVESPDDESVTRAMRAMELQPLAGIVVLKFDPPGVAALRRLPPGVPVVAAAGTRERLIPQAVLDEKSAAFDLVGHVLSLGHKTVHHVRVPPSRKEDLRTTGWRDALTAAGRAAPDIIEASWEPESGRLIGHDLAGGDVTAVFCGNDEIAMGLMRGLAERGVRVPEEISVVGFDDHPLAAMWSPALTTVRQDFAGLGGRAYALLERAIEDEGVRKFSSIRPEIVIRESTAPPPARRG